MSNDQRQTLLEALLNREQPAAVTDAVPAGFATFLVDARRQEREEDPVPSDLRRRIVALGTNRPVGALAGVAQWLFDSWHDLAPAARGVAPPRLLRLEDPLGSLDVEVERLRDGAFTLRIALDEGDEADRIFVIAADGTELGKGTPGERGMVQIGLTDAPDSVQIVLMEAGIEWVRTPLIPLA